ncbi:MAG: hypothetical protein ACM3UN_00340 [Bacillota bacterium]
MTATTCPLERLLVTFAPQPACNPTQKAEIKTDVAAKPIGR